MDQSKKASNTVQRQSQQQNQLNDQQPDENLVHFDESVVEPQLAPRHNVFSVEYEGQRQKQEAKKLQQEQNQLKKNFDSQQNVKLDSYDDENISYLQKNQPFQARNLKYQMVNQPDFQKIDANSSLDRMQQQNQATQRVQYQRNHNRVSKCKQKLRKNRLQKSKSFNELSKENLEHQNITQRQLTTQQQQYQQFNAINTQQQQQQQVIHQPPKSIDLCQKKTIQLPQINNNKHLNKQSQWQKNGLYLCTLIFVFFVKIRNLSNHFSFSQLRRIQMQIIGDVTSYYEYYFTRGYFRDEKPSHYEKFIYKLVGSFHRKTKTYKLTHMLDQHIKIINPDSSMKRLWDFLIIGILLVNIYYIPIYLVFSQDTLFTVNYTFSVFVNVVPQWVFVIDMILNFNTAFSKKGVLIKKRRKIATNYLKNGFIWDALVILSFAAAQIKVSELTYFLKALLFLRINKVMQITSRMRDSLNLRGRLLAIYRLTRLILVVIFAANFLGCILVYVAIYEQQNGDTNWVDKLGINAASASFYDLYVVGFYFAAITMLTVGYGDIYPVTTPERLIVTFMAMVSCGIYAYSISQIGDIFRSMNQSEDELKERMAALAVHLQRRNVSYELQERAKKYFQYQFEQQLQESIGIDELLKELPKSLYEEICREYYYNQLSKSKILDSFSQDFLKRIAENMTSQRYGPEEVVFKQGDPVHALALLVTGDLVLSQQVGNRKHIVGYKKKSQPVGLYNFFSDCVMSSTAETVSVVKFAMITREQFLNVLNQFPLDKERYHKIKHLINFSTSVRNINLACPSCQSQTHYNLIECPYIQYIPNKKKLLAQHKANKNQVQERTCSFKRLPVKFNSALSSIKDVQYAAIGYRIDGLNLENSDQTATFIEKVKSCSSNVQSEFSEPIFIDNESPPNIIEEYKNNDEQKSQSIGINLGDCKIEINNKQQSQNINSNKKIPISQDQIQAATIGQDDFIRKSNQNFSRQKQNDPNIENQKKKGIQISFRHSATEQEPDNVQKQKNKTGLQCYDDDFTSNNDKFESIDQKSATDQLPQSKDYRRRIDQEESGIIKNPQKNTIIEAQIFSPNKNQQTESILNIKLNLNEKNQSYEFDNLKCFEKMQSFQIFFPMYNVERVLKQQNKRVTLKQLLLLGQNHNKEQKNRVLNQLKQKYQSLKRNHQGKQSFNQNLKNSISNKQQNYLQSLPQSTINHENQDSKMDGPHLQSRLGRATVPYQINHSFDRKQ